MTRAPSTTWYAVSSSPSALMKNPLPSPPDPSCPSCSICTLAGRTFSNSARASGVSAVGTGTTAASGRAECACGTGVNGPPGSSPPAETGTP